MLTAFTKQKNTAIHDKDFLSGIIVPVGERCLYLDWGVLDENGEDCTMSHAAESLPTEDDANRIPTREMVLRLIAVAELLKKSTHQPVGYAEINPVKRSKNKKPNLLYRN